ncbi:MAG: indole-3-glycerol phosphate synthase TrpC [Spirochaetae bacterium HGW-Spirochaetae-1]|jgi:indole-3-glycerol phosphate synthase|nr:MAG: indole-3-glycerol phosphate synthase TrpC [Spirochaetae bacterium HGW-Spirochaetae-1]
MATILDTIVEERKKQVEIEKHDLPVTEMLARVDAVMEDGLRPADFLSRKHERDPFLIAEIKKASPSKGVIRRDFDISDIAGIYNEAAQVSAVSVLTEPRYFQGSYDYLVSAGEACSKPLLMKDFIFDPYQVMKGFLCGASAFLLIASLVTDEDVKKFSAQAKHLGMRILFETHTIEEYRRAMNLGVDIIGINNRDLNTFNTDIHHTLRLIDSAGLPTGSLLISESGIRTGGDVAVLRRGGVQGFLIGEEFMKHGDIGAAITAVMGPQ